CVYETLIRSIYPYGVECEILKAHPQLHEPTVDLTLAVGLLKNPSRMDWIIEKGTELGVSNFMPLLTRYTISQSVKEERWKNIALAAMKQCGRCMLPKIFPPMKLKDALELAAPNDAKLIPFEKTEHVLFIGEVMKRHTPKSAIIFIGPEGGFTNEEIVAAEGAGCMQVSLGPRRLRTETAAIVAASWVVGSL
ncbi:MAG TPA: RsmE family RNA methyltransferase, partial [Bacteroidota bacterium]|nr:RsmE family RNA methyltransferase [Bacteroidota bacterium]